jgi:hypothetical protein
MKHGGSSRTSRRATALPGVTAVERTGPQDPAMPASRDNDRLIVVTEGELTAEIAARPAAVPAQAVIVIPAGVPHRSGTQQPLRFAISTPTFRRQTSTRNSPQPSRRATGRRSGGGAWLAAAAAKSRSPSSSALSRFASTTARHSAGCATRLARARLVLIRRVELKTTPFRALAPVPGADGQGRVRASVAAGCSSRLA